MHFAGKAVFAFCMLVVPFLVLGETCTNPQVKSSIYTTTEAASSMETVFIVQFSLKCSNSAGNLNLFADVNGKTLAVTRNEDNSDYLYQVSLSGENKVLPSGTYEVKFYDEDGYSNLRKAQRSGDGASSVSSLFSITVQHPGVWKGPLVPSEAVAVLLATSVFYFAYVTRSKLQSS